MSSNLISEETVEQIKKMLRGRVEDLQVLVREQGVVIRGTATNFYGKQVAQHVVLKALTISNLVNEIEVRRVPSDLKSEADLELR